MKVQVKNVQRPKLIEPFFDKELFPDNSFASYIEVSLFKKDKNSTPNDNISKNTFIYYENMIKELKTISQLKILKVDIIDSNLPPVDKVDLLFLLMQKIADVSFPF